MDSDLKEVLELSRAIKVELDKGIVELNEVKEKCIILLFSEIPSNIIHLLGPPGFGKTVFGVVFAGVTDTNFGRVQGRADLVPADILGSEIYNFKTSEFEQRPGVIVTAEFILVDEFNRTPPKSQSAFLEPFQEGTVTIGNVTHKLPDFRFGIVTTNPVEIGQGTHSISEAASDRFAFRINVGSISPNEEQKLVNFDVSKIKTEKLVKPKRVLELRSAVKEKVKLHPKLATYIRRIAAASRPKATYDHEKSVSPLVEEFVQMGGSNRVDIFWGPTCRARALIVGEREEVYPEDIQALAYCILSHRLYLSPIARTRGVTVEDVIEEILTVVPIP
jgi:MoxR-like ATPase